MCPYNLFYWDVTRLRANKELESKAINAYLPVLACKHNRGTTGKPAAVINSYAMTALWMGRPYRLKIDPMAYKIIVGILNEHHHWVLTGAMRH
ncbi:hypothetical protein MATL_G00209310 [Megalops atlanticus]|uniref:Uncharacterized protein n=1 Tax=Megalops atlanticus TaxID=7932 RepID=A0A9D3PJC5_MEGAT|nr:hypothetical protein MATL_G00209310 [Megalops atlanticus]